MSLSNCLHIPIDTQSSCNHIYWIFRFEKLSFWLSVLSRLSNFVSLSKAKFLSEFPVQIATVMKIFLLILLFWELYEQIVRTSYSIIPRVVQNASWIILIRTPWIAFERNRLANIWAGELTERAFHENSHFSSMHSVRENFHRYTFSFITLLRRRDIRQLSSIWGIKLIWSKEACAQLFLRKYI